MKLPLIKRLVEFAEENDIDYLIETQEVLEHLIDAPSLTDEELDVLGELLSNLSGAMEVYQSIKSGTPKKDALNQFMQRVLGAIDK